MRKKGKENRPKKERKSTTLLGKEKDSFEKVTARTSGALHWRPNFEQRSSHQTKICHT